MFMLLAKKAATIYACSFIIIRQKMDTLSIKSLAVETRIGVHAWEQHILQRLLIDIIIPLDLHACDEALELSINYETLCNTVTDYVQSHAFQLIETVANRVADLIKTQFKVSELSVQVSKPQAIKNAADVRITVNR